MAYMSQFFNQENGIETFEFLGLLGIVAGIFLVIVNLISGLNAPVDSTVKQMNGAVELIGSLK